MESPAGKRPRASGAGGDGLDDDGSAKRGRVDEEEEVGDGAWPAEDAAGEVVEGGAAGGYPLPPMDGPIEAGGVGPGGETVFFALNAGYYSEIARRAELIVVSGAADWGRSTVRATCDMEAAIAASASFRGLLRRKNAYVWQTRLMIERTSLNAGHFDHPLCAAVAYDFAQTFLRPSLKNANGTAIALNFPGSASDTRVLPVTAAQGMSIVLLERPGVELEQGHFWSKDDVYYAGV